MTRGPKAPALGISHMGSPTGRAESTSGIIGTGVAKAGGMFGDPDVDPSIGRRSEGQQRAYVRALEAEREERRTEGDTDGVRLCDAELATVGVTAKPTPPAEDRPRRSRWRRWKRARRKDGA